MKITLFVIGGLIVSAFSASVVVFAKERTVQAFLQLLGSTFLIVVLFAHIAETFHLLPRMGWGLPDSAGHYIDLISAVVGLILVSTGYILRTLSKRRVSN
jgi:uncharacterized membrane protein